MRGLEPIQECEEPEEDSFLMVRRPSRGSCSLVKHSTPAQPEESRFTVGSDLVGTETASSDFSQATTSRRASPGHDHLAPLPSVEEGEDSGRSHSLSPSHLQVDVSRVAEDAVTFPRQPSEETPTQSVSPYLIYDAMEDATDTPMEVGTRGPRTPLQRVYLQVGNVASQIHLHLSLKISGKHRKAQPGRRKRMRSADHRLPPKKKKMARRGVNRQRRVGRIFSINIL